MCAVSAFNRDNHYTRHTEKAPHSRETWAKQRYVVEGPYTETEMVCVLTASRMNVFGWLWDVAFFVLPELCSYYCSRFFFRRLSSLNVAFGLFWTLRYCRVAGLCCFFLSICIRSVDAQTFSVCVRVREFLYREMWSQATWSNESTALLNNWSRDHHKLKNTTSRLNAHVLVYACVLYSVYYVLKAGNRCEE